MISLENQAFFDFVGNEVMVGDLCVTTSSHYREFVEVRVVRLTACTVWVAERMPNGFCDKTKEFKRVPSQIIKVGC